MRNELWPVVTSSLQEQDFYSPRHRLIFRGLRVLHDKGDALDPLGLREVLGADNTRAGGLEYFFELSDQAPASDSFEYLLQLVRDHAIRRRIIQECMDLLAQAQDNEFRVERVVDALTRLSAELTTRLIERRRPGAGAGLEAAFNAIEWRMQNPNAATGLATRFTDLNQLLGGIREGMLTLIASGPSTGKTTLAANLAVDVALIEHVPILFFSLQLDAKTLWQRMVCAESKVLAKNLLRGTLDPEERNRLIQTRSRMALEDIQVHDPCAVTVDHICRTSLAWYAERLATSDANGDAAAKPHGLIIVDSLGLVRAESGLTEGESVADITRKLKDLARETRVPVLLLCQTSQGAEEEVLLSATATPRHLTASDIAEEVADVVMLLHRDRSTFEGLLHVSVTKNRHGRTGDLELFWHERYLRFENLSEKFDDETSARITSKQISSWMLV